MKHVGLSLDAMAFDSGQEFLVCMVEMQPPLNDQASRVVDVVGSVELTAEETQQIKLFVDELRSEYQVANASKKKQYTIYPHFRERNAANACRSYSCAGFVVEAYSDTGIDLLRLDQIPEIDLEILLVAYRDLENLLRNADIRTGFGLEGDGPWPVLLPGYLLHATNRSPKECRESPYTVTIGDQYFPARKTENSEEQ
ncbi:MAG: hypothetical protein ACI9G1_000736 [Pirellulaceae bacterium]